MLTLLLQELAAQANENTEKVLHALRGVTMKNEKLVWDLERTEQLLTKHVVDYSTRHDDDLEFEKEKKKLQEVGPP